MQETLKKMIVKLLREVADKIEGNTCELSESEAMDIMGVLSHQVMSKEDACLYYWVSGRENVGSGQEITVIHYQLY